MPYDLFISYARRDNECGQVTALKAQIEVGFRAFAGRDLRVFFDTHEIVRHGRLAAEDSAVLVGSAGVSGRALVSLPLGIGDYVRYEAMRQRLGEGVAPVFFVTLPDAADPTRRANRRMFGGRSNTSTPPPASGWTAPSVRAVPRRAVTDLPQGMGASPSVRARDRRKRFVFDQVVDQCVLCGGSLSLFHRILRRHTNFRCVEV